MNLKEGNLVRVLPGSEPGYGLRIGVTRAGAYDGLLGIVARVEPSNRDNIGKDNNWKVWLHLQNGIKDVYFYEFELKREAK